MFERFTDRARRVLVLAQEEARLLNHSFFGTEHLLLGLLAEKDGVAAKALADQGVWLEAMRARVETTVGRTAGVPAGSPPFTPRAKKVLELSLRESLALGHGYIGTEHLLLGLLREGEGVAVRVLVTSGVDLERMRAAVLELIGMGVPQEGRPIGPGGRSVESGEALAPRVIGHTRGPGAGRMVGCGFCGRQPPATGRLIAGPEGYICEHCVADFSDRLARNESESSTGEPEASPIEESEEGDSPER